MATITKEELFRLRNHIKINFLITEVLTMKTVHHEPLRFCCPDCQQYHTATKEETNLARCFSCEKNFNTIDLVIRIKGLSFTESVVFLRPFLRQKNPDQKVVSKQLQRRQKPETKIRRRESGNQETGEREIKKMKHILDVIK